MSVPIDPQIPEAAVRRVQVAWSAVSRQPGWVTRAAVLAFLLVVALPIALLVAAALAIGVVVFAGLALISGLGRKARGWLGREGGRSNVRVIVRDDRGPH